MWEVRYYVDGDHGRVPQSAIIGNVEQFPTETLARKKCESILLGLNKTAPQYAAGDPTFGALIERYVADENLVSIVKTKLKEARIKIDPEALEYSTAKSYLSQINNHIKPKWASTPLSKMKPMLIQEWLRSLDMAPKSKGHLKSIMHRLFERAMFWELLDAQRNPMQLVEIKGVSRRKKKPVILTPAQYYAVLEQVAEPYHTMVIVAQCLGLRVSEILALQWDDINFGDLTMRVARKVVNGRVSKVKTEYSEDDLPLDSQFAECLLKWYRLCQRSEYGWVFPNPNTLAPYWASEIQKDFLVPAGKKAGIESLGWHTFRHTYRSWLVAAGAPIGVQQKLMRHAQVSTTMDIYGNAQMESKREANSKVVRMVLRETL